MLFLTTGQIVPTTLYQIYNSIAARIIEIAPEEVVVFAHLETLTNYEVERYHGNCANCEFWSLVDIVISDYHID
jgi:hypothetical protein